MDRPDCSTKLLSRTLRQFSITNRLFSSYRRVLKRYVISDMLTQRARRFSFLDLGAGGCDVDLWLARHCRRKGIELDVTCIDHDRRVVEYARAQVRQFRNITVTCGNALEVDQLGQSFDYVFANHLLHHLETGDVEVMLKSVEKVCRRIFLFNDVLRCRWGYLAFSVVAGIFLRNSFAYSDGRVSIKRGFTICELGQILDRAKLSIPTIVRTALPGHVYIVGRTGAGPVIAAARRAIRPAVREQKAKTRGKI